MLRLGLSRRHVYVRPGHIEAFAGPGWLPLAISLWQCRSQQTPGVNRRRLTPNALPDLDA